MILELAIKSAVCGHYGIPIAQIEEHRRDNVTAICRHLCYYFYREVFNKTDIPLSQTSLILIGRRQDHSTVIHGINVVRQQIQWDKKFAMKVLELKDIICALMGIDEETEPINLVMYKYKKQIDEIEQLIPYNNVANF